jgi:hypothetical protein
MRRRRMLKIEHLVLKKLNKFASNPQNKRKKNCVSKIAQCANIIPNLYPKGKSKTQA